LTLDFGDVLLVLDASLSRVSTQMLLDF
jgi:hypothetical protein